MPRLDLTPDECQSVAQACRIAGVQAERNAANQTSPNVRKMFQATIDRYRALAEKLEQALKSAQSR